MVCDNCGAENANDSIFCHKCGNKIEPISKTSGIWYYINSNDEKMGPFQKKEIISLIKQRKITSSTLVWSSGMDKWKPASETALHSFVIPTPPPCVALIRKRYAYALSIVPLAIYILSDGMFSFADDSFSFIIAFIANVIFLTLDTSELNKHGIYGLIRKGIILVPWYLFSRANKTDKDYSYAIINCIALALYASVGIFVV